MTEVQNILIRTISVSLGCDSVELPTCEIDWKAVIEQAYQNEVPALIFDGYKQIHDLLGNQALPQRDLLEWIGQSLHIESLYQQQLKSAADLAEIYANNNICTYILKGFSIAQFYPNPSHRYSCDFLIASLLRIAFQLKKRVIN